MMHRDEAIYARSDARGVTLTAEEADFLVSELNGMLEQFGDSDDPDEQQANACRRALAARLEAASTTPSP